MAAAYRGQPSAGARALNSGGLSSPKAMGSVSSMGSTGSFGHPAPGLGAGPMGTGSFAPAGSFPNPSAGATSFGGPGLSTAAACQDLRNAGSFKAAVAAGGGSFAAGGSFTGAGSFTNLGVRPPPQQTSSFSMPGTSASLPGERSGHGKGFEDAAAGSAAGLSAAASSTRPLNLGSYFGSGGNHGPPGSKVECQDQQCAEEECDPNECGDENRPPNDDNYTCGIDRRPLLPVLLVASTLTGALHMMMLEFPLMRDAFGGACCLRAFFLLLYAATLGCMAYCVISNPGLLQRDDHRKAYAMLQQNGDMAAADLEDLPLPKRCHKAWLYQLPVRRYDHFCRWLTNCIGLLNHREFIVMVAGLVAIGVFGALLDAVLVIIVSRQGGRWIIALFLLMHLAYSVILTSLAGPIFRLHVGFISRNELANEWKRNDFYVVTSSRTGRAVPVNELSDDEFNERFDAFEYDPKRNSFDRGLWNNCWSFWCTPRWAPRQLGEF